MADVEARLIVKVVDEATRALKGIQKEVGGISQYVRDNKAEFQKFGLAAAAAGGLVEGALLATVAAAREEIAVEKQLNAVLASTKGAAGVTADEAKRLASSLQSVT